MGNVPQHHEIEHSKELLAYFRHITTLSTGSLVLLATFMEKLFSTPKSIWLVVAAIILFILSVGFSVISQSVALAMMRHTSSSDKKRKYRLPAHVFLYASFLCFFCALFSMGAFTIVNLLCQVP